MINNLPKKHINLGPYSENFAQLDLFYIAKDENYNPLLCSSTWGLKGTDPGFSVFLFPTKETCLNFTKQNVDLNYNEEFVVSILGDPFEMMLKSASHGAKNFEIPIEWFDEKICNFILQKTKNRVIFPFLSHFDNLSNHLPTAIGAGSNLSKGIYLTKKGEKEIKNNKLCLWENNEIIDQKYISICPNEPFLSPTHDPFWCFDELLISNKIENNTYQNEQKVSGLFFFEKDSAVKEFCSPEGYYPVFTTKEDAINFKKDNRGGRAEIVYTLNDANKNYFTHSKSSLENLKSINRSDLKIKKIKDLYSHLIYIQKKHDVAPWINFIINPRGHRYNLHHGKFSEDSLKKDTKSVIVKSVNGIWSINTKDKRIHITKLRHVDSFEHNDTFFLSNIPFKFTQIPKSYAKKNEKKLFDNDQIRNEIQILLKNEDKLFLSDLDTDKFENFYDYLDKKNFHKLENKEKNECISYYKNLTEKFCLQFWNKVSGEVGLLGEPLYFDSFLKIIAVLIYLEQNDRVVRIFGTPQACNGYIGFDGTNNKELEENIGITYEQSLINIYKRVNERGYTQKDGFDVSLISNKVFKSIRIDFCGYVKDALSTFIPSNKVSMKDLCNCLRIPEQVIPDITDDSGDEIHFEAELILEDYIDKKKIQKLLTKTKLFLSTALFNFKNNNGSLLLDYAPVSVQIVKALENELRVLVKESLKEYKEISIETEDEQKLKEFIEGNDKLVSLGFLGRILRKSRNSEKGPLKKIKEFILKNLNEKLLAKDTIKIIENDALYRFRNGGAHDKMINYSTCKECIHYLIGNKENPGILLMFQK